MNVFAVSVLISKRRQGPVANGRDAGMNAAGPAGGHSPDFIPLLSMTGRPYISSPASRGRSILQRLEIRVDKKKKKNGVAVLPNRHKNGIAVQTDRNKTYRPSDKEPFMNERQREYFRDKLLAWREGILKEVKDTLQHLQDENQNHADFADRASSETDRAIELRARDRQRKLIAKIDAALHRIDDGTYGYCEEIGEPIALKRLEARPIATLSVEGAGTSRAPRAGVP
jgi:DnaK suppressor protein